MREIRIVSGPDHLADAAAEAFIHSVHEILNLRSYFTVALSGGSTPKILYRLLASKKNRSRVNWSRVHVFWGDERCVKPTHKDSNYRMARKSLLKKVPIPSANIHRFPSELPPDKAAEAYAEFLKTFFGLTGEALPCFDLILLGLGTGGHTASLFPGSDILKEKRKLAIAHFIQSQNAHRLTLTLPVINHGRKVLFIISGQEKAEIVRRIIEDSSNVYHYPARQVQPENGRLIWFLDRGAASVLNFHDERLIGNFTLIVK